MSGRRDIQVAPSLLAADFADLSGAVKVLDDVVGIFHIDIMDGHFVPNITMGPMVVEALRPHTEAVFDVHLMVANPDDWIGPIVMLGTKCPSMMSMWKMPTTSSSSFMAPLRSAKSAASSDGRSSRG